MFSGLFIDAFVLSPYFMQEEFDLDWNIAGFGGTPNVLSELTYDDIEADGYGLNIVTMKVINDDLAFYVDLEYSAIEASDGSVQDSDYMEDNQQGEFSRSFSSAEDSEINNVSVKLGAKSIWFDEPGHYYSFLLGYQENNYDMSMTNGQQTIPFSATISGLDSTYDAEYESWLIGFASEHVFTWGTIGIQYEWHDIQYSADAVWNLRDDFAQDPSFTHKAEGNGTTITAGYTYPINSNWGSGDIPS